MRPIVGWAILLALGLSVTAHAQQQSLEEQLRSQLRDTRSQLQDLQGQQAQWQSQKSALEGERDQAKKALEQAQSELAKARANTSAVSALAAEKAGRQKAEDEARQAQAAYAQASNQTRQQASATSALNTQLADAQKQVQVCSARNDALYKVGEEILDAYAHMDMGTMMSARQPFAASARVRLENAAQGYGDRMYEQRFVPARQP